MRHGHISADGETKFHDHPDPTTTHYPGEGLDAATEAFNAFKLLNEKFGRLDTEGLHRYYLLVGEFHQEKHILDSENHNG